MIAKPDFFVSRTRFPGYWKWINFCPSSLLFVVIGFPFCSSHLAFLHDPLLPAIKQLQKQKEIKRQNYFPPQKIKQLQKKEKEKKEYFHQPAIASDKAASVHKGESLVHFPDISITIHSKIVYLYLTFICMYLMFECSQCTSQPTPSLLTLQQRIVKS